jgi:uncharacterized protein YndB with AHSA1/START domain
MPDRTRGYAHRIDIRVDIDTVWRSLIEPELLARWYTPATRVDAREGGSFWSRPDPDLSREAHIDVFAPPRRLRLIYLPVPELSAEEAVIVDDFLLDRDELTARERTAGPVTVLRLLGSGIPESQNWDAMYLRLRGGWERALRRLKVMLEPSAAAAARSRQL